MGKKLYEETNIQNIANAIRAKNGSDETYITSEMAAAISAIQTGSGSGGITPTGSIDITENGTFDVTNYASAIVNVATSGGASLPLTIGDMEIGTVTVSDDIASPSTLSISHSLDAEPTVMLVLATFNSSTKGTRGLSYGYSQDKLIMWDGTKWTYTNPDTANTPPQWGVVSKTSTAVEICGKGGWPIIAGTYIYAFLK